MNESSYLANMRVARPLVCHVTNYVSARDCAQTVACLGGTPVMIDSNFDAEDMVSESSSLVLNIGTVNENSLNLMINAGKVANKHKIPIVFDPVGAGSTSYRNKVCKMILSKIDVDVIKGNAGEISFLAGMGGKVRGTESISEASFESASELAKKTGAIVAMSGSTDYISNGETTVAIPHEVKILGTIPGTGCMLSSAVGCFVGSAGVSIETVTEAFKTFIVAAENVSNSNGPGLFMVGFFDKLSNISDKEVVDRCQTEKL